MPNTRSHDTNTLSPSAAPQPQPVAAIPSALEAFSTVIDLIARRTPALFLDYDGTLAEIAARPELATLPDDHRRIVAATAKVFPTAIISGRDRPDVEALVGLPGLTFAGSHGFDIAIPGRGQIALPGLHAYAPRLDQVAGVLHDGLASVEGSLIERKAFSVAAHHRLVADEDYPQFRAALDRVLENVSGIKEKTGKKVFEFQPDIDWDKGTCVLHLLDALALPAETHIPLFIGDDVTDEDAFRALKGHGIGIVVADPAAQPADRKTYADFRLTSPTEVLTFLVRLTERFSPAS